MDGLKHWLLNILIVGLLKSTATRYASSCLNGSMLSFLLNNLLILELRILSKISMLILSCIMNFFLASFRVKDVL